MPPRRRSSIDRSSAHARHRAESSQLTPARGAPLSLPMSARASPVCACGAVRLSRVEVQPENVEEVLRIYHESVAPLLDVRWSGTFRRDIVVRRRRERREIVVCRRRTPRHRGLSSSNAATSWSVVVERCDIAVCRRRTPPPEDGRRARRPWMTRTHLHPPLPCAAARALVVLDDVAQVDGFQGTCAIVVSLPHAGAHERSLDRWAAWLPQRRASRHVCRPTRRPPCPRAPSSRRRRPA